MLASPRKFPAGPGAVLPALVLGVLVLAALLAPWVSPHDPYDIASLNLLNSYLPPAWSEGGDDAFLLGTDNQGRDVLSGIIHGSRVSLLVGLASVALSLVVGVAAGVIAGYGGGWFDALLMRVAEIQLTFPTILVALLLDGLMTGALPQSQREGLKLMIVILAIGLSGWPQFARATRSSTLIERGKDYVLAARVIGVPKARILFSHVLPNITGPVLIIATLGLGNAILAEATLSFLGLGVPPTQPSLGTLIRVGNDFLFSGMWWMAVFPSIVLASAVLAINMLGDSLRDFLDPRLR